MGGKTKTRTKTVTVENPVNAQLRDTATRLEAEKLQMQSDFTSQLEALRGQYSTAQQGLSEYKDMYSTTALKLGTLQTEKSALESAYAGTQALLEGKTQALSEKEAALQMTQEEFNKWKDNQTTTVIKGGLTSGATEGEAQAQVSSNRETVAKPTSSTDVFLRKLKRSGVAENLSNTGLSTGGTKAKVYAGLKL